ncbi:hypothetical protein [Intestinibacter sp.]|uniref:hypothetical protein n=1 Tax=Intestinibacter sp. TaxID=1965304 RepID=UPI003F188A42
MLKYVDTAITFLEVPNEITLCINISNCPCHCKGCHSSYLADDIGEVLVSDEDSLAKGFGKHISNQLYKLIRENEGITCICFMGGDSNPADINFLARAIKLLNWVKLKVAWYSGRQELSPDIDFRWFDYIKLGPYVEELGPLNKPTTNQKFYKVKATNEEFPRYIIEDNTYLFWNDTSKKTSRDT